MKAAEGPHPVDPVNPAVPGRSHKQEKNRVLTFGGYIRIILLMEYVLEFLAWQ